MHVVTECDDGRSMAGSRAGELISGIAERVAEGVEFGYCRVAVGARQRITLSEGGNRLCRRDCDGERERCEHGGDPVMKSAGIYSTTISARIGEP